MGLAHLAGRLPSNSQRRLAPLLVQAPGEKVDAIWREFFADPSQWDDHRATKFSSKYPDFKHKTSNVALWIDKKCNPEWVKSALKSFDCNLIQDDGRHKNVLCDQIFSLCKNGDILMAVDILDHTNGEGVDITCCITLLQECIKCKLLTKGKQLHAHIIRNGFEHFESISSTLVKLYATCESLLNAQDVFDEMQSKNSFAFNTLVSAYVERGFNDKALRLYHEMQRAEVKPDKYTFMSVFKACANLKYLEEGEKAHASMADAGIAADAFLSAAIVNMYVKCGSLKNARCALDAMQQPNIVSYTAMIAGYAHSGNCRDALELFDQIQTIGVKPDVASCNAMISGFADNGYNEEALKFFQKIQDIVGVPDTITLASILKACANLKDLGRGHHVHAYIVENGINMDPFLEASLVNLYAKCGSLENVYSVFKNICEPNLVSWTSLIMAYAQCGKSTEASDLFQEMQKKGVKPDIASWNALIAGHAQSGNCEAAKKTFEQMQQEGFKPNSYSWNARISGYVQQGDLQKAEDLYGIMLQEGVIRDVGTYNAMIAGYAQHGSMDVALELIKEMHEIGLKPDVITWTAALSGCAHHGQTEEALRLFREMEQSSMKLNCNIWNAIISVLAQRGHLLLAYDVFQEMKISGSEPNAASWTALISGFAQNGHVATGLELMKQMKEGGVVPDVAIWTALVAGYAHEGCLESSLELFSKMQQEGVKPDAVAWTSLIGGHVKNGQLKEALDLMEKMKKEGVEPSIATWNALIAGHAVHGSVKAAEQLFQKMQDTGIKPNSYTWNALISVYSHHGHFEEAHRVFTQMQEGGIRPDVISWNALIAGYMYQGLGEKALQVLTKMESLNMNPNVVSWNAIIAGYVQKGFGKKAISVYMQMQHKHVNPNCVTFTSVLSACTSVIARVVGKHVHSQIIETELLLDSFIENSFIDMYAKFGDIEDARFIFDRISSHDIVAWSAMIAGYAMHGNGEEALLLLERMKSERIKPNNVTFTSILSACSHAGLVNEGSVCFNSIRRVFGMAPSKEHYACMVDLLGRAGHLKEAVSYIKKMPMPTDAVVWMALLGSCKIHADVQLAEHAANEVLKWEPDNASVYVILSNIYASNGMQREREKLQRLMVERGIKRQPGRSFIEVDGEVHEFVVGDKQHPRADDIYKKLDNLRGELRAAGYKPDKSSVLHSMDDADLEASLCFHSEKLAIAFGLISTPGRTTLRIVKNLRVCIDCHNATKLISKITERNIIVRDANRIHSFKDGVCSCKDMW